MNIDAFQSLDQLPIDYTFGYPKAALETLNSAFWSRWDSLPDAIKFYFECQGSWSTYYCKTQDAFSLNIRLPESFAISDDEKRTFHTLDVVFFRNRLPVIDYIFDWTCVPLEEQSLIASEEETVSTLDSIAAQHPLPFDDIIEAFNLAIAQAMVPKTTSNGFRPL